MTTATTNPVEHVLAKLDGVSREKDGQWQAHCPAHEDRVPSLSVGVGGDGRVLLHCQAGCTFDQIVTTLKLERRDLFPNNGEPPASKGNGAGALLGQIVRTHDYRDESGAVVCQTVRYEPKDFRQRRPDGRGG